MENEREGGDCFLMRSLKGLRNLCSIVLPGVIPGGAEGKETCFYCWEDSDIALIMVSAMKLYLPAK